MSDMPNCPKCGSEYTYEDGSLYVCPECAHEWSIHAEEEITKDTAVRDVNGNILQDGDSVAIAKTMKVKGASSDLKIGTKVKNIRIVDEVDGHNIEAKIPGFGVMMLKGSVVKKTS